MFTDFFKFVFLHYPLIAIKTVVFMVLTRLLKAIKITESCRLNIKVSCHFILKFIDTVCIQTHTVYIENCRSYPSH